MAFNSAFKGLISDFHVHTTVPLDNYQSFLTNWCTIAWS